MKNIRTLSRATILAISITKSDITATPTSIAVAFAKGGRFMNKEVFATKDDPINKEKGVTVNLCKDYKEVLNKFIKYYIKYKKGAHIVMYAKHINDYDIFIDAVKYGFMKRPSLPTDMIDITSLPELNRVDVVKYAREYTSIFYNEGDIGTSDTSLYDVVMTLYTYDDIIAAIEY